MVGNQTFGMTRDTIVNKIILFLENDLTLEKKKKTTVNNFVLKVSIFKQNNYVIIEI